MSIKLGVISVDLIANTVSFSDGMTKASQISLNTSKNIQRSFNMVSAAATAMASSVIAGLEEALSHTQDFAFEMSRFAEKTGTSVEMFSKLAYSAKVAGVPLDMLKGAMERLARTAGNAQNGQKEAIEDYKVLGITAKDLNGPLSDSGNLLIAVSKKLETMRSSTSKTNLEQKLLGRTGSELAPMLRQLAEGFDSASEQATLFGVVLSEKAGADAKKLHESLSQVESVMLGFSLRLLSGVSPALAQVSQKIVGVVTSADGMKRMDSIAQSLATVVTGLGNAFVFLFQHGTAVKTLLEGMVALKAASIFLPMISGAMSAGTGFGTLGMAALTTVGKLSGFSKVLPIMSSVTEAAHVQAFMLLGLAREEGVASARAYALSEGLATVKTALASAAVPLAILTVGLAVFAKAMSDEFDRAEKSSGIASTWGDRWTAAMNKVAERGREVKLIFDGITNSLDAQDTQTLQNIKDNGILGNYYNEELANVSKQRVAKKSRYWNRSDLWDENTPLAVDKVDAPHTPKDTTDKIDILAKKMMELRDAAQAAMQSLRDAGKGVDFQRADEIAKEQKKTIDELTISLKAKGRVMTEAQVAQIKADIATKVNSESQAKYRDELQKTTDATLAGMEVQLLMNRVIGTGAAAVRQAAIEANAAERDRGQSDQWKKLYANERAKMDADFGRKYDATAAGADKTALNNLNSQITAQMRLNGAIMLGTAAREQANLAEEQAAIKKGFNDRGDADKKDLQDALDANEKLFNAKKQMADLERAASMDPAQQYRDQVKALDDAADAANRAGKAIDSMQMASAKKADWLSYQESVDKVKLSVGSMSDGVKVFFDQMTRESASAAEQVHTLLGGAFTSLNEQLVNMLTGQKASFADFFRSISAELAKIALNKVEIDLARSIMVSTDSKDGSSKSSSSGAGGFISSLFGSLLGGFGGHKALGGDVVAGKSYDVGEMGRETFTPTVSGRITPNRSLGGNVFAPMIDARGSNDPAQVEAAVHRAMGAYGPQMVAASMSAASEKRWRSPSSSAR